MRIKDTYSSTHDRQARALPSSFPYVKPTQEILRSPARASPKFVYLLPVLLQSALTVSNLRWLSQIAFCMFTSL